jgi:hypothetical protein
VAVQTAPAGIDRKTIPAPLAYGSILLVLVQLVVAVWGFGGFKKRRATTRARCRP